MKERDETNAEFHKRVQDQLDSDSWAGRSTVGAEFPTRKKVLEIEQDYPDVIYRGGKRKYGDGY